MKKKKKEKENEKPTERQRLADELNTHDGIETIAQYIIDKREFRLSPKLEECCEIYNRTADLLQKYGGRGELVKILIEEFGISERQADTYIIKTQELLPIIDPILNPAFYKSILYKNLLQTRRLILESPGDKMYLKALNDNDRNLGAFIKELVPDKNAIDPELLKPKQTIITNDASLVTDNPPSEADVQKLVSDLLQLDAQDIKFEENYEDDEAE